ncbi:MAG: ATP-dependent Clp protease ATP-binding subunit [Cryobacterium sp.]|nr:ATP-dependent Clp protease ATP-binding subunit [Oligoflexia bacterium]
MNKFGAHNFSILCRFENAKKNAVKNSLKNSVLSAVMITLATLTAAPTLALADKYPCIRTLRPELENPHSLAYFNRMKKRVIGQDPALTILAERLGILGTGLQDPGKPLGTFLFVGPTSVGKTESANALTEALGGNPEKDIVIIDCTQLQESTGTNSIVGAAAGYVGYGDKPLLHPENLKAREIEFTKPGGEKVMLNVILIDELEKAHDNVFRTLLPILDVGVVTLADGTKVNMRNAIIIVTSNLGAKDVQALIEHKMAEYKAEAKTGDKPFDPTGRTDVTLRAEILKQYDEAMKKRFAPEFKTRFQEIVQFLHLGNDEFNKILLMKLAGVQKRLFRDAAIKVAFGASPEARQHLITTGTSYEYGARELNNIVNREIISPLSRLMSTEQIVQGDALYLTFTDGKLKWSVVKEGLKREDLIEFAAEEFPDHAESFRKIDSEVPKKENQETTSETSKNNPAHSATSPTTTTGGGYLDQGNLESIYEKHSGKELMEQSTGGESISYKLIDVDQAGQTKTYKLRKHSKYFDLAEYTGAKVMLGMMGARPKFHAKSSGDKTELTPAD